MKKGLRHISLGLICLAVGLGGMEPVSAKPSEQPVSKQDHFYGRDRSMGLWRSGNWVRAEREGHEGWWWVVGQVWYLYPLRVFPYPDPYQEPILIVQPENVLPSFGETPEKETHIQPPPPLETEPSAPAFTDKEGRTCREYQSAGQIAGETHQVHGTACLQPDGTWHVVH